MPDRDNPRLRRRRRLEAGEQPAGREVRRGRRRGQGRVRTPKQELGRRRADQFETRLGPLMDHDVVGPWSVDQGVSGLLRTPPLIDAANRIMVYWSPKSACTSVYAWFAAMSGFIDEVQAFNSKSPHQHRKQVFNRSPFFQRGVEMDPADLRAVKVLREPYGRAVSIYRHALKTGFADKDLDAFSGGKLTAAGGFSFQQFLDMLDQLDFGRANIHYRPQLHVYESIRKPDRIINISNENMFEALNGFAVSCGLPAVDLAQFDWLHAIEHGRKAKSQPVEGDDIDRRVFDKTAAIGEAPFPSYQQLLTPTAKDRIRKIYAVDFEAYADSL
ncbi:MAG: sulfotransferase family 2 domain-containing protein [Alphaproteobacteria bacterium]|nr:sulfotransferase family 2 domain-containing protein [Alphaproteobacteria bacterium]